MYNKILSYLLLFLVIFQLRLHSQTKDSLNYTNLGIIGGATTAAFIYGYVIQNNIWWKGQKSDFHFNYRQDWTYALGSDKYGHFFFGSAITKIYGNLYQWCGLSRSSALFYSAITAFSYQTFIEIRDGFSKDYGFSIGDWIADFAGAVYPNLQLKYPWLKNINFKISYYPSERFKSGSNRYLLDDYESTYNWLTINLKFLTPQSIKQFIPGFINLAFGHSVKKLDTQSAQHEFFISLDWNFEQLKTINPLLNTIIDFLDLYHFPAPAVKIYPDVIWYGLKF